MKIKNKKYRDFYEDHVLYGAKHCDLEVSQWGVSSDPFREEHGQALTKAVFGQVPGQGGRILDVGCGQGHILSRFLSSVDEAIGIDISKTRVYQCTKRLREKKGDFSIILADAEKLPFAERSFGIVLSTEVIEHVPSDKRMLREIFRVLRPGGILILSTPNAWNVDKLCFFVFNLVKGKVIRLSGDFPENLLIDEHVRYFNIFLLRERLEECGFRICKMRGVGFIPPPVTYRRLTGCPWLRLFARMLQPLGRLFPIFSQTLLVVATRP